MVHPHHEFDFMVNFTRMATDVNGARQLHAIVRLDKENRRRWLLVAQFSGVLCKRSDGAP